MGRSGARAWARWIEIRHSSHDVHAPSAQQLHRSHRPNHFGISLQKILPPASHVEQPPARSPPPRLRRHPVRRLGSPPPNALSPLPPVSSLSRTRITTPPPRPIRWPSAPHRRSKTLDIRALRALVRMGVDRTRSSLSQHPDEPPKGRCLRAVYASAGAPRVGGSGKNESGYSIRVLAAHSGGASWHPKDRWQRPLANGVGGVAGLTVRER